MQLICGMSSSPFYLFLSLCTLFHSICFQCGHGLELGDGGGLHVGGIFVRARTRVNATDFMPLLKTAVNLLSVSGVINRVLLSRDAQRVGSLKTRRLLRGNKFTAGEEKGRRWDGGGGGGGRWGEAGWWAVNSRKPYGNFYAATQFIIKFHRWVVRVKYFHFLCPHPHRRDLTR